MKVSKWGNSLAIRLPAELVEKLALQEGDELYSVPGMSEGTVNLHRKKTKEELWARQDVIRKKLKLPADTKFPRKDAYDDGKF